MLKDYLKYFIGFFITVGLIIALIIIIFGGNGGGGQKTQTNSDADKTLNSLADTDTKVRTTIQGPINAEQVHEQIRITIDRENNNFEFIRGYENNVVDSQNFVSNEIAFTNFLHALTNAGFGQGDDSDALADERGSCPFGQRYIFEIIENGKVTSRYWSTDCGNKTGSYLGNTFVTLDLFKAQIPNYDELTDQAESVN